MRHVVVALASAAFIAVVPSSAFADGGPSIADATPVQVGQQEFGNTATGGKAGTTYSSWWALSVRAGDQVTLDWEGQPGGAFMYVYPTGTTDFNVDKQTPLDPGQGLHTTDSGRAEFKFTAPVNGTMPIVFQDGAYINAPGVGPYNFTIRVVHRLRVAGPPTSSIGRRSVLRVAVHAPDGGLINDRALDVDVQINAGKGWRTVGTAPVMNSTAAVHVRISSALRHHKLRIRALAHGLNYRSTSSAVRRVRVR